MRNLGKHIANIAISLLGVCPGLSAQDLNPTVEVSRQYRGAMIDIDKPSIPMAVPDSVMRFNLEFDYSVFDSPFRGSYEFRPFLMDMDLAPGTSGEKSLYLRAGLGYTLHPELDFVWSPFDGKRFRMSVYAMHRSYIGKYRQLGVNSSDDGLFAEISPVSGRFSGHDMLSEAGIDGSYDWDKGIFAFNAGYYGTALKDTLVKRGYDGFDLSLGIASKDRADAHFAYRAGVHYRYAEDKADYSFQPSKVCMTGHDLDLDLSLGGSFPSGHSVAADLDFDLSSYGALYSSTAGSIALTPRYLYRKGRWNLDLGVKVAFLLRNNAEGIMPKMNTSKGQVVYPDAGITFTAIRKHLDLYLAVGGGPDINSYSSLLSANRHITPLYNIVLDAPLLDNTVERVSAAFGLKGNIASRLRYDLSAGYRNFANAPLETVVIDGLTSSAGLSYGAMQMFFTRLDYGWKSQDVDISGRFQYQGTDIAEKNRGMFAPAAFTGFIDFRYNWRQRIFLGIDCGFSTARKGSVLFADTKAVIPEVSVPGYADLGATVSYAFSRKCTFWLHGGNLLDMTVQRTPLYCESGIYYTVGLTLNL